MRQKKMIQINRKTVLKKVLIVVGSHFTQMLSAGMSFSFGILYSEIRQEFGKSQLDAAWAAAMFNSFLGFVGNVLSLHCHPFFIENILYDVLF